MMMMLAELKRLANKRDVAYQSFLKIFIAEGRRDNLIFMADGGGSGEHTVLARKELNQRKDVC